MNLRKKYLRWLAVTSAAVTAIILLTLLSGLLFINSQSGRDQLVKWVNTYFAAENENIKLGAIEGSVFSGFTITRITLSDEKGTWLELEKAEINWSPLSLLGGELDISNMSINAANIYHLPKSDSDGDTQSPLSLEIPTLPIDLNVAAFDVATIEFGNDIIPAKARFYGGGQLKLTEVNGIALQADMVSLGRNKDQITVNVTYPGAGHNLTADILVNAPKGGTFGALVGIDPAYGMTATFKGDGTIDDWAGALRAQVNNTDIADAAIQVSGQALTVRARLNAGEFIPDTGAALFGRTANLTFDLKPTAGEYVKAVSLDLVADTMKLNAQGNVATDNLTATEGISFTLDVLDALPFNRMVAPLSFQPFSIQGVLSDLKKNPTVTATFTPFKTAYGAQATAVIAGRFSATLKPRDFEVKGTGTISNMAGASLDDVQPLTQNGFQWKLDAEIKKENFALTLHDFTLENQSLQLDLDGKFASDAQSLQGSLNAAITDIGLLIPSITGSALLNTTFDQASAEVPLHGVVKLSTNRIISTETWLNELMGPSPSLDAQISRAPDGTLILRDTVVSTKVVTINGGMFVSNDQVIEQSDFQIKVDELDKLEILEGLNLEGSVDIAAHLSGLLASPSLALKTSLAQLDVQGFTLQDLTANLAVNDLFTRPQGAIELVGLTNIGALAASANFNTSDQIPFKLSDISATIGTYGIAGSLTSQPSAVVTGDLTLATMSPKNTDAQQFGIVSGQIAFKETDGLQQIDITGNLIDLTIPVGGSSEGPVYANDIVTLKAGTVSAAIVLEETTAKIDGEIKLSGLSHPSIQAKEITLTLAHQNDALAYNMHMLGTQFMPYDLIVSGDLKSVEEEKRISLSVQGNVADTPVRSLDAINLTIGPKNTLLKPFQLKVADGTIGGSLVSQNDSAHLDLAIDNADLRPLGVFFPDIPAAGILKGQVKLSTSPDKTAGEYSFSLSNMSTDRGTIILDPALTLSINGSINEAGISATGAAQLAGVIDAGFTGQVPLRFHAGSFSPAFPEDEPLQGKLNFAGNIGAIWPIFELVNHDLRGFIDTQFQVGGTFNNPNVNGHINLMEGRYENTQTGFVATNIDVKTTIADRHLVVDHFTANDGADGRITAAGFLDILSDFSFNAEANLVVNRARIIRRPTLDVTASSNLSFVKNGTMTTLSGDITVDSANVGAVTQGPADVIELDVREINGNSDNTVQSTIAQGTHLGPLNLDLNFSAPGKLFIRSYGLDSEWSSEIKLQGSSRAPVATGSATLIRGVFDFSGKRFTLTKGTLYFPNDNRNDPLVDITAEYQLVDLTAQLIIGGRASSPALEMRSTPSLPQDEILSRIFFGTSVAALSPIEAVQLAATVHSLSTGGGPGLIGSVRRSLGIDRLAIDQANGRDFGTTITGGKYLTNNIYVEVSTAPATGETSTAVEVSLTRNLSLITRRTLDSDNNLAIRWSWNY